MSLVIFRHSDFGWEDGELPAFEDIRKMRQSPDSLHGYEKL